MKAFTRFQESFRIRASFPTRVQIMTIPASLYLIHDPTVGAFHVAACRRSQRSLAGEANECPITPRLKGWRSEKGITIKWVGRDKNKAGMILERMDG